MAANNDVFRSLADSTRRLILEELRDNNQQTLFELCTRLIMEHDVDMTRQGVSNHLEVLEAAGLITSTRQGKYKIMEFTGTDQIAAVTAWLDSLVESDRDMEADRR